MPQSLPVTTLEFGNNYDKPFYIGSHKASAYIKNAHVHRCFELGLITSGEGFIYYDGKQWELNQDDLYFLDGTIPHSHGGSNLCITVIHFTLSPFPSDIFDDEFLSLLIPFLMVPTITSPIMKAPVSLTSLFRKAYSHFSVSRTFHKMYAWCTFMEALVGFAELYCNQYGHRIATISNTKRKNLISAIQFIHTHAHEPLNLEEIAHHLALSPSRLSHVFSELMGISPIQYRNRIRLTNALERLVTTDTKISVIAHDVGFDGLAHFYRQFKRFTGTSPSLYRKQHERI